MSAQINLGSCFWWPGEPQEYRAVFFPDGSKVSVTGLNNIFEHAYKDGKIPDSATGKYLIQQLGEINYIPSNSVRDYEYAVLKMYKEYFELMEKRKKERQSSEEK